MQYLVNLFQQIDFGNAVNLLLRAVAVILCLTVHETSHGLAAYVLGDPTAKREHRLSLNPLRHVDLVGLLMMFFVGFGWAKPVPVDMRYFKKPKSGMAITAFAGPLSNFLLALLLLFIARMMYFYAPATELLLMIYDFVMTTAILSIGLGIFNLIPIPPLDGSKVLFAFLPDQTYLKLMYYERYGMIVLLVLMFVGAGDGFLSTAISAVFRAMMLLVGFPH